VLNAVFHMFLVSVLRYALFILVPLSLILSSYLYLYPVFHLCAFPAPERDARTAYINTLRQHTISVADPGNIAPFRLLALGDPQLEGDSSIPDPEAATFPHLSKLWRDVAREPHNPLQKLRHSLHDIIDFYLDDIPKAFEVYRKRLDHIGNDYYLGHIYRTLYWWTNPTHVTVLGDLVGSQWIDDDEFDSRGGRFWKRVFRHGERVPDELASAPVDDFPNTMILGHDAEAWKRRIINVAGNHDIGYAGDISPERMARFVRVFGKANYELRFQLPINISKEVVDEEGQRPAPEIRIVVINDMNLDTPASSKEIQDQTYQFLNDIITTSKDVERPAHFTLVLTHIPMHKEAGICVDAPFFDFFQDEFDGGVKEQNHLSADASKGFLEGIFGMSANPNVPGHGFGRHGLILTGHDHEGCDTYHYINQTLEEEAKWEARKWEDALSTGLLDQVGAPGMREITVRSMMGDFAGNAGLMSLWFDEETWDWRFEFVNCGLGTQHIWWVTHILDLITAGVALAYGILAVVERFDIIQDVALKAKISNGKLAAPHDHVVSNLLSKRDATRAASEPIPDGFLDIPGLGKKSLRKKRSKRSLSGSPTSSPVLGS
jgi:hypothetical protein